MIDRLIEETNRPSHLREKGLDRASKCGKVCQGIHMYGPVLSIKTACHGIMFLRTWEKGILLERKSLMALLKVSDECYSVYTCKFYLPSCLVSRYFHLSSFDFVM